MSSEPLFVRTWVLEPCDPSEGGPEPMVLTFLRPRPKEDGWEAAVEIACPYVNKRLTMPGCDPLDAFTALLRWCQAYLAAMEGRYEFYWETKGDVDQQNPRDMVKAPPSPDTPSVFAKGGLVPAGDPERFSTPSFRVAINDDDPFIVIYAVRPDGSDTQLTACMREDLEGATPDETAFKLGRHLLQASEAGLKLYGVDLPGGLAPR